MTTNYQGQDDAQIDTVLRSFSGTFGISSPIANPTLPIKRLGLHGATRGRYFEFPPTVAGQNNVFFCD